MPRSYVVTGAARGIGRAIADRLLADPATAAVVVLDREAPAMAGPRLLAAVGDAADERTTEHAAELAEAEAPLAGWVNNAAVFHDASPHETSAADTVALITANLAPAVAGATTAVRRFLAAGTPGAIVNVSSHQAARPVAGSLPYATAKAAVEGLTRALAVEYGPRGVRVNAVALGSISTGRYERLRDDRVDAEMRRLHPLGRVGTSAEVAAAVAYLLSDEASFISGATLPVDGGRSVLGRDPEERA